MNNGAKSTFCAFSMELQIGEDYDTIAAFAFNLKCLLILFNTFLSVLYIYKAIVQSAVF